MFSGYSEEEAREFWIELRGADGSELSVSLLAFLFAPSGGWRVCVLWMRHVCVWMDAHTVQNYRTDTLPLSVCCITLSPADSLDATHSAAEGGIAMSLSSHTYSVSPDSASSGPAVKSVCGLKETAAALFGVSGCTVELSAVEFVLSVPLFSASHSTATPSRVSLRLHESSTHLFAASLSVCSGGRAAPLTSCTLANVRVSPSLLVWMPESSSAAWTSVWNSTFERTRSVGREERWGCVCHRRRVCCSQGHRTSRMCSVSVKQRTGEEAVCTWRQRGEP